MFHRGVWVSLVLWAPLLGAVDEAAVEAVSSFKIGDKREALRAVEAEVAAASRDTAAARAIAARMVEVLESRAATHDARDFACRQLALIGTSEHVGALAKLLGDEKLSHIARVALEAIPGEAAAGTLREAAARLGGELRIGAIQSLGQRRDEKAVDVLAPLLKSGDGPTRLAVAEALGHIASERSAELLTAARAEASGASRPRLTAALLTAADGLVAAGKHEPALGVYRRIFDAADEAVALRTAALRGMVTIRSEEAAQTLGAVVAKEPAMRLSALRMLQGLKSAAAERVLVRAVRESEAEVKVVALEALAARPVTGAAAGAAREAAASADAQVAAAALRAMGRLGDAQDVGAMAGRLVDKEPAVRDAAKGALTASTAEGVNAAILAEALKTRDEKVQGEALKLLPARRATDVSGRLLELAGSDERAAVRRYALEALAELAAGESLAQLVGLLVNERESAARDSAEKAVAYTALRLPDGPGRVAPIAAAHKNAAGEARASLLRVLGRLPGPAGLAPVRADVKHDDAAIRDAAVRALSNWPDMAAGDDLLMIVKTSGSETHRILALRGYIRLIGVASDRRAAASVKLYEQAMALCGRVDEKRMVLAGLANVADAAALEAVSGYESDAQLKREAGAAKKRIEQAIEKGASKRR